MTEVLQLFLSLKNDGPLFDFVFSKDTKHLEDGAVQLLLDAL